jgi:hypothetical protein
VRVILRTVQLRVAFRQPLNLAPHPATTLRSMRLMPITVKVKGIDAAAIAQRAATAQRVINYFALYPPESRLLCFLDDQDPPEFATDSCFPIRGFRKSIHDSTGLPGWPEHLTDCIYVDDIVSRVVDELVYLFGSACSGDEVGMIMTLAHELQHTIQRAKARKVWAANTLINGLRKDVIDALKLKWANIPIEKDARIVAKCVAENLCGAKRVGEYIHKKIAEPGEDVDDWQFVLTLKPSDSVDLVPDTRMLFNRLRGYRFELEKALQGEKDNPDFTDLNLNDFFPS